MRRECLENADGETPAIQGQRTHLLQNGIERDQDPFESGKVAASAPEDGSSPSERACRVSRKASGGRKANPAR